MSPLTVPPTLGSNTWALPELAAGEATAAPLLASLPRAIELSESSPETVAVKTQAKAMAGWPATATGGVTVGGLTVGPDLSTALAVLPASTLGGSGTRSATSAAPAPPLLSTSMVTVKSPSSMLAGIASVAASPGGPCTGTSAGAVSTVTVAPVPGSGPLTLAVKVAVPAALAV